MHGGDHPHPGQPVRDAVVSTTSATLPPTSAGAAAVTTKALNGHGHYTFRPPDLAGTRRPLRDPDHDDDRTPRVDQRGVAARNRTSLARTVSAVTSARPLRRSVDR